jgi:hypothetical protein
MMFSLSISIVGALPEAPSEIMGEIMGVLVMG